MQQHRIDDVLRAQDGVISRRQVLECEGTDNDIERLVRRRRWTRVHTGVFVAHTGPLTWLQRAWAACLAHAPAALAGESALRARGLRTGGASVHEVCDDVITIAVAGDRRVTPGARIRVVHLRHFEALTQRHLSPPLVRLEHALLDVAAGAHTEAGAVAVLGDACQLGRTTPERLLAALEGRPRLPRRALLRLILADVVSGARSALERSYLVNVERPHGLPTGRRQRRVRAGRRVAYRDVEYLGLATVVELDGRLGHERAGDRWADLDRDIDSTLAGDLTVRIGWGQVLEPCRAAAVLCRLLHGRGWGGTPRACGPTCPVGGLVGDSPAPGAGDPSSRRRRQRPDAGESVP